MGGNWAKCHNCYKTTQGRRFCVECAPLYRMGAWKEEAEKLHQRGVRPLSIAVRIGVNARTVINHLKSTGQIIGDEYQNFLNDHTEIEPF